MKKLIFVSLVIMLVSGCYYRDKMDMAYESYVKNRNNCNDSQCRHVAAQQFAGQVDNIANSWEKWSPPDQMKAVPAVETKQEVKFDPAQPKQDEFTPTLPVSKMESKSGEKCSEDEESENEESCIDEEAKAFIENKKKEKK